MRSMTTIAVLLIWLAALLQPFSLIAQDDQPAEKTSDQDVGTNLTEPSVDFLFNGGVPENIEQLKLMEQRFAGLSEKLFPATVNIQIDSSQGSGVVVTSDGYILTAAHVIGGPNQVARIEFPDGQKMLADTLGVNRGTIDSGMLKLRNPNNIDFPYIDLGISEDLKVGQWVMAVGHPGGIDTARGLVTRVGRLESKSDRVLITDCTLVGGDSGGPLIDMKGNLIGIHSRIGLSLANNLHVPVDQYSMNWDKLADGLILSSRPSLGFDIVDDTNEIKSIAEDKSADKAGLKAGDRIVKIDQMEIANRDDLAEAMKSLLPNEKIEIVVLRGNDRITLPVTVGER